MARSATTHREKDLWEGWRSTLLLGLTFFLACYGQVHGAEAPDVVVLRDGRKVEGKLVREDDQAVFLKVEGGEERGIAKSRIAEILRAGAPKASTPTEAPRVPVPNAPPAQPAAGEANPPGPNANPLQGEMQQIFEELKDIGHSNRELRKAAIDKAVQMGFRAMPVLLALFHPQQRTSTELRIGSLRALAQLGPLDNQGALTLGYAAMKDPDPEVRREACQTIRALKEDRALQYILGFAIKEDKGAQYAAARALREIDDERAFMTLAAAIPAPTVNASPEAEGSVREVEAPVGPYGSKMPLYLPTQSVTGTVTNVDSPPALALKIISGKDLGNFPGVWINWIREKVGSATQQDREEMYKKRSVKDRMGSPHVQNGP